MITNDPIAPHRIKQEVALSTTHPVDGPPGVSDMIGHHGVLTCLPRLVGRGAPLQGDRNRVAARRRRWRLARHLDPVVVPLAIVVIVTTVVIVTPYPPLGIRFWTLSVVGNVALNIVPELVNSDIIIEVGVDDPTGALWVEVEVLVGARRVVHLPPGLPAVAPQIPVVARKVIGGKARQQHRHLAAAWWAGRHSTLDRDVAEAPLGAPVRPGLIRHILRACPLADDVRLIGVG